MKKILYGGDYNPNQWPEEIWQEDMRMFHLANINSTTINVFSWAKIQPSENVYDFSELDKIVQLLSDEKKEIVMATSTGALPAWLFKKYPEVGRTDYQGRQHKFGHRHNACPNSLVYQKYAQALAEKLAQRYGDNPNIAYWHVNNEYGGECYCENCTKAFRVWLQDHYKTLDQLNAAWNTEFWGHTIYEWDEIVAPNELGDGMSDYRSAFAGMSLDYCRFNSDAILNNYKMERDAIKKIVPQAAVTTNLMGTFKGLDYFKWAKEMDIISWDNYPAYNTPWSIVAMNHELMRGLKDQPFLLMEQTPSQQNWQPYNSLKKPGQMRAQSYQTLAHGGDSIQFFQLRRSVGACEKFHGAVIEHVGHEHTRVFGEVAELGEELTRLDELVGATSQAEVGVIFDWENYWGLEYTSGPNIDLRYVDQIHKYYRYFYENHIPAQMISVDSDFSKYKFIVAPVLYLMKAGLGEKMTEFVKNGGTLLTTYMSGIVNESDNVYLGGYPGPLREVSGIWVEEIDALAPEQTNTVQLKNGTSGTGKLVADLIHLETAESLGEYTSNFYAGMPMATVNHFGAGLAYYFGTDLSDNLLNEILDQAVSQANVQPLLNEKTKLEITQRFSQEKVFTFILNLSAEEQVLPAEFAGKVDVLKNQMLNSKQNVPAFASYLIVDKRS
ncbi:beta-galactosidase [Enterococcus timonensis]|uniref:beta-galactosidase n=1 Tax=Enterococcus timonensis TaxID=1852364 RepID=UPI0008DA3D0D|nr:beta-galactosidase [Enterococcus timonensis]